MLAAAFVAGWVLRGDEDPAPTVMAAQTTPSGATVSLHLEGDHGTMQVRDMPPPPPEGLADVDQAGQPAARADERALFSTRTGTVEVPGDLDGVDRCS